MFPINAPGNNHGVYSQLKAPGKYCIVLNSPEKWLHNWICYPSNRSKQIQETHTAYSACTQYTRQSLNEKQHTWLHRQQVNWLSVNPCVLSSAQTLSRSLVCRHCRPCEFLGFVWTDCWGDKSNYVITSTANKSPSNYHIVPSKSQGA